MSFRAFALPQHGARRLLPLLACLLLWCPVPAFALSASVQAAGMYGENISTAPRGQECAGVHAKLVRQGDAVPAQVLTRFGMELLVEGGKKGAPARLDVVLSHPPLQQPGQAEPVRSRQWEVPACVGMPVLVAWTFLADWELTPGEWTFDVSHQGTRLLSKTFQVVEEELPEPEAQLSISLTPKTAPAPKDTANAGAVSPESAVVALGVLRGIEPGMAALVLDEAEAKRLAARSTASGLPAVVKPVQRSSGQWHAVVVWDFAQPPSEEPAESAAAKTPGTSAGPGALAVQVAAYQDPSEAVAYADSLAQHGVQVFIESLRGPQGPLHTVRVGPFDATRSGRDQAVRSLDKLRTRGVRLPLLTRTPEPVEHVALELPPPPAAQALSPVPDVDRFAESTPLNSMEEAKSKLHALLEQARPDEVLEQARTRGRSQENATAADGEPRRAAGDDLDDAMLDDEHDASPRTGGGLPGMERRPRVTPAVEEFAKAASRGVSPRVQLRIGPFATRAEAEAFRKLVTSKDRPATVADVPGYGLVVQADGFPNVQAASTAGAEWIARHAPEAGVTAMMVAMRARDEAPLPQADASADAPEEAKEHAATRPARSVSFALQVAATASRDEAERQCAAWTAKGLDARMTELPGALGRVFAVRVGNHGTLAAAQAAAESFRTSHGVLPMVVEEAQAGP